jgi:CubicO group peptidase (beta-lactamase class C family)
MQINVRLIAISNSLLLAFVSLSAPFAVSQNLRADSVFKELDTFLSEQTAQNNFRGSVLVGIHGAIKFEKSYGFADEEWNALNTPVTRFRIFSLTKQFTAACILRLQERGVLSVHDLASKLCEQPSRRVALDHNSRIADPYLGNTQLR